MPLSLLQEDRITIINISLKCCLLNDDFVAIYIYVGLNISNVVNIL